MRQSLVLGDPSDSPVRQSEVAELLHAPLAPAELEDWRETEPVRRCLICRQPLAVENAKVHPGDCARKRKSQLQRLARWRARR